MEASAARRARTGRVPRPGRNDRLATLLSRSLLDGLCEDFEALASDLPRMLVYRSAARHHLLQDDFVDDIARLVSEGSLSASRLEIRISERTFAAMSLSVYQALHRLVCRS